MNIPKVFFETYHRCEDINIISNPIKQHPESSIPQSNYLDEWVKEDIYLLKWRMSQVMMVKNINIEVNIFGKTAKDVRSYMHVIQKTLVTYIHFLFNVYPSMDVPKPLKLYVYLTDKKKTFPADANATLTPYNVNTGFTIFDPTVAYNTIVVYREEEVFKVLIHELTHYFQIDSVTIPNTIVNAIRQIFMISNDPHLHEAITDFWACYINILYNSLYGNNGNKVQSFIRYNQIVKRNINKEKKFILSQARKVAAFTKSCNPTPSHEATHVISYYIIKAAMFSDFLNYLYDYLDIHTKPYFISNIVEDSKKLLGALCHDKKNPKVTNHTLRMSSIDVVAKMKTI